MSDQELVHEALSGDTRAYRQLIEKYQRLVVHMVARVIDNHLDREELCQDIFVRIYDKLSTFKFDSKLSTWIATIAYRMAVDFLKKKKRRVAEQDLDKVAFQVGQVDHSVENADFTSFIHTLILQMPLSYRTILTLYHIDGFSYPEIVAVTGLPEGTVKNYLFRARKKLRELSEPYMGKEIHTI